MKRKRKIGCLSPLLDDSPKRTKVHAQRKFAQGSNVNSPALTPIKELESEIPKIDVLPDPVELLPIKRPNTEDFLTFLCFRGTPILPPSLNFFNTASIVDTNGQVHEIKGESPKNGPIDIAKCGTSSEKPFIAFGVRKRADPIVISRQMDKKRRHALALQALRRKYQEQKMAKIRALTISKLSEKVTNKTLVRTNTVSKTETVTKKTNTLQKIKVVATKHVKVTTQTLKTTLRPKIKPKMCLRSFRGRFVQKELPFRKRVMADKKILKKPVMSKIESKRKNEEHEYISEDEEPLVTPTKEPKPKHVRTKVIRKTTVDKTSPRITRSGPPIKNMHVRIKQIKKRILLSTPNAIIKPRSLRSTTMKKTILSQRKSKSLKAKQKLKAQQKVQNDLPSKSKLVGGKDNVQELKKKIDIKKEITKSTDIKQEINKSIDLKKSTDVKKVSTRLIEKKESISKCVNKEFTKSTDIKKETKCNDISGNKSSEIKKDLKVFVEKNKKEMLNKSSENNKKVKNNVEQNKEATNNHVQGRRTRKDVNLRNETNETPAKNQKIKNNIQENKKTFSTLLKRSKSEDLKIKDNLLDTPKKSSKLYPIENKKQISESMTDLSDEVDVSENIRNETNTSLDKCKKINKSKVIENKKQSVNLPSDKLHVKNTDDNIKESVMDKSKRNNRNNLENKNNNTGYELLDKASQKEDIPEKITNSDKSKKNMKNDMKLQGIKKLSNLKRDLPDTLKNDSVKSNITKDIKLDVKKDNKSDIKHNLKNNISKNSTIKVKRDVTKRDEENVKEENITKKDDSLDDTVSVLPKTQRPSRKTKEAAAIYMEILSHKLVNDSKMDDDNVSIDSFPELPNVKKTQQRENELKAQAKYTKDDTKLKSKVNENEVEIEIKHVLVHVEDAKLTGTKQSTVSTDMKKMHLGKRKSGNEVSVTIDNPDDNKKLKVNKTVVTSRKASDPIKDSVEENKTENSSFKRLTRNCYQSNKNDDSDDSDESFHIDIKVPRSKKLTRSKTTKSLKNEEASDKIDTELKVSVSPKIVSNSKKGCSSSDSDQSTTSDINLQALMNKAKNKKFSKTKSMKKTDTAFSDSDEEPLSKLTNRSIEGSQKSALTENKIKEKSLQDLKGKEQKTNLKTKMPKTNQAPNIETEQESVKPKRECAKRPQNYLPMLSSSDEDDIFHGFEEKTEEKNINPVSSIQSHCTHAPPFLDLLSKDIGRRFGKEKVNMSNEQIEKWLKDSALAGSSIKKENDEMLKFGERIPTEISLDSDEPIDTQKIKTLVMEQYELKKENSEKLKEDPINVPPTPVKVESASVSNVANKPQIIDRKLIFRKSKKDATPNVNAFSPENESSVYAFGEENEDVISTPFRRPSRRPSSTATSRSEDESSKHDESVKIGPFRKPTLKQDISKSSKEESDVNIDTDESSHHFYIPQKPTKHNTQKSQSGCHLNSKLKTENKTVLKLGKVTDKISEIDDFKYKIPSSPSASSSSSAKIYKRQTQKPKIRPPEFLNPIYVSDFPKNTDSAKLVEAPVFHPTDQEFQDPLEYIERIRHKAEQFGICRIVPPSSFKPECKVLDDMRFTAYNQYVNKMLYRWGPNFKELMAIKKYLETQNISLTHPPWIGGMEIDLPRLYQTVQTLGGLKEVIEKKKWPRVSELMKIPKSAQDRVTKLDDIYCKYLLPYDTLSPAEREKLFDEVETEWAKRESKTLLKVQQKLVGDEAAEDGDSDENEAEECITKGRNMALNAFYRIARNTMSMYFKTPEPSPQDVEQEYWKHVTLRQNHICVLSGSIDSGSWGYGFAVSKNSPFARHPWNLKVLTNNNGSVLRSLGPIMGVTIPTLHVGMVFSACCWYRDPHGLPWIEYLHTGGSKIWYGIPNSTSEMFHTALKNLVPNYCKNKELWLPSDTVMVPPSLLVENNVSLCRTVQDPGQFVVVFPKTFTSSISTGYVVSESVYFAPPYWIKTARTLFNALRDSKEPSMFSLDRLILNISLDGRCNPEILRQIVPYLEALCDNEKGKRLVLSSLGKMETERMPLPEAVNRKKKRLQGEEGDYECEICRMNLFVSMVFDTHNAVTYCLDHALEAIKNKKSQVANCKFMFSYDTEEIENLPKKIQLAIENKLQKKVPNKYAGMPTLLK